MAASSTIQQAWNNYVNKYEKEPSDAQHFFQESLHYAYCNNCVDKISFQSVKYIFDSNKGKGKINPSINTPSHITHMPSDEELDDILKEIDETEQKISNAKEYLTDKCYLFYCPSMRQLANDIQNKSNGQILLGGIDWENFNDGFPNLMINKALNLRMVDVAFLADLSDPKNIFEQYSVMCALPRHLAKSVKIFVGYFPTGTMERVQEYGRIATAMSLARLLSSIPCGANGPVQICVVDIHTLQNQFYFSDNILVRLETCTGLIRKEMREMKDCSVCFPDEGAYKRFGDSFEKYPQIICTKIRDGNQRSVKLKEGTAAVKDRNIVIIDDLVQSGGTLAECGELMKSNGCQSVSCFVTHSVFPKQSWKRFCKNGKNEGLFETFYVTDTIPMITDALKGNAPFKVLSVSEVYLPIIQNGINVIGSK